MFITIFAVIVSIFLDFFFPQPIPERTGTFYIAILILSGGLVILGATLVLNIYSLTPLQSLEQNLVPHLMELIRHDWYLRMGRLFLFLFSFLSIVAGASFELFSSSHQHLIFLAWLIVFGFALDMLRDSWHRIVNFLSPKYLVECFAKEAKKAIQNGKEERLWHSLDSLSEICLRSIEKSKLALSTQSLQTFSPIMHVFFAAEKSISHRNQDEAIEKKFGQDETSYTIFYLLQRLELIYDKALHSHFETVCRQMIVVLGKIIVYGAKLDLSTVSFPTHFLAKFGLKAQQNRLNEVAILTTSTLLIIAKTIVNDIDLTYMEIKDAFRTIIKGLENLAKGSFKKDKYTNINVLTQPLVDLKILFESPKMATHRDTPLILQEITQVLDEFAVLQQVMGSIPPISDTQTDF
jgi:hypothetical protein